MRSSTLVAIVLAAVSPASARKAIYQRYADSLLSAVTYIDVQQSASWPYFVQYATATMTPILKNKTAEMTLILPSNQGFEESFIQLYGGNSTDPATLGTAEWVARWNDIFPYFVLKGILNTSAVADGETAVYETYKRSPVGDWPLTMAFRREAAYEGVEGYAYNGTIWSSPFGSSNITIPDYSVYPDRVTAQILNNWVPYPVNLSTTITDLQISGWEKIKDRLSAAAGLETQRNYTLFLPPTTVLTSALALSDAELLTFVNNHLVADRVILTNAAQTLTTVGGGSLSINGSTTVAGTQTAKVISRDVFTNGIIIQAIDQPLVALNSTSTTTKRQVHSEEL